MREVCRWLGRGILPEIATNLVLPEEMELYSDRAAASSRSLAVVSGATGGIGECTCRRLAGHGYTVVVAARDSFRGESLAASIRANGGDAVFLCFDASAEGALKLANAVRAMGTPLGLIVNNAGCMGGSESATFECNLIAASVLSFALLDPPGLGSAAPATMPRIVNVASSAHWRASSVNFARARSSARDVSLVAYAESKLGLLQVSTLLRRHQDRCSVHDVHPGLVWTPMLR